MITLSKRQLKAANRFTGAVYVLPWPNDLQQPVRMPVFAAAFPAEEQYARNSIGPQLAKNNINILDIEAGWPDSRPPGKPAGPRLFVYAIHKRWPQTLERSDAGDHAKWVWI